MEHVLSAVHWFFDLVDTIAFAVADFVVGYSAWLFGSPAEVRTLFIVLLGVYVWFFFFMTARKSYREEREMHRYDIPGDFCSRVNLEWFALGALADRPIGRRRVVVVTEKPLSIFDRCVAQISARVFGGELRYFHGELDVTFVARHAGRFDVVIVGPFAKAAPAWITWLSNGVGVTHRAEIEHFVPARVPYARPAVNPALSAFRDGSKG